MVRHPEAGRMIARAAAARRIPGDHGVAVSQALPSLGPHASVGEDAVEEDDRRPAAGPWYDDPQPGDVDDRHRLSRWTARRAPPRCAIPIREGVGQGRRAVHGDPTVRHGIDPFRCAPGATPRGPADPRRRPGPPRTPDSSGTPRTPFHRRLTHRNLPVPVHALTSKRTTTRLAGRRAVARYQLTHAWRTMPGSRCSGASSIQAVTPTPQGGHHAGEIPPCLGRHVGKDSTARSRPTLDDTGVLQGAQPFGQQGPRGSWRARSDLRERRGPVEQDSGG